MNRPGFQPAPGEVTAREAPALTVPFTACAAPALDLIGGKGAGLARLLAAGLPVPPGFCVTAAAYRAFLAACPEAHPLLEALAELKPDQGEQAAALAAQLRAVLLAAPWPAVVEGAVVAAAHALPASAWAVRSSATAEDLADASFAGLHDTFLNVPGPAGEHSARTAPRAAAPAAALMPSVRACWASLFTERATAYRLRRGLDPRRIAMAVVVQEFIPAEAAGVLFTADPVTGQTDRLVIEAARGLGDAVVSGHVTPDRAVLAAAPPRVVEYQPGVPAAPPVLDHATTERLAELGLRAQQAFGQPVDVEWALADGQLHLLQARPITTLPAEGATAPGSSLLPVHGSTASVRASTGRQADSGGSGTAPTWEDRQVWTNANSGEVLPDVISPLTWSILEPALRDLFNILCRTLGIEFGEAHLITLIAGRAYFNYNTLQWVQRRLPGLKHRSLGEVLGGSQEAWTQLQRIELRDEDLPPLKFHPWRALGHLPPVLLNLLAYGPRRGAHFLAVIQRANADFARRAAAAQSPADCLAVITALADLDLVGGRRQAIRLYDQAGAGLVYHTALFNLCERWFGTEGKGIASRLMGGLGGVDSAEAGLALWRLAEAAHAAAAVCAALLQPGPWDAARARLAACPGGAAFLAQWDAFLARHGHHARGEIELLNPRWCEQPDLVLGHLRDSLQALATGRPSPQGRWEAAARQRQALAATCRRRLPWHRRWLFDLVLHRAQIACREREGTKSILVARTAIGRRLLLALGDGLAAGGALSARDDVFFLTAEDLPGLLDLSAIPRLRERIAARRAEHARNLELTPPPVVIGRFDPAPTAPPESAPPAHRAPAGEGASRVFTGLPVSAGVVRGPARVILHAGTDRVQPGEILVAPFTDPGWSPYFLHAAGLVVDMGGLLSHGSIIAREYGLPAVVNVGAATRVIRTGQWIEVDGTRGVVTLLDAPPSVSAMADGAAGAAAG